MKRGLDEALKFWDRLGPWEMKALFLYSLGGALFSYAMALWHSL